MDQESRDEVRKELASAIGEHKVLWKKPDIVPYTKDTFRIRFEDEYKFFPDLVVLPETTDDVQRIVKIAAARKIPIIPKGGGTSRTGMLVPIKGGIVIDTIKMNRVIEVNVPELYVTVQPGITLKELENHLEEFGLALNQEQGSFKIATIGGSISTAGFSRKHQKYGTIADRVMSLEVVLADGRVMRTGAKVLYTSTGYRLSQMFIGAEGTLGIITEATVRVEPLPEAKEALLAFYDDFWTANDVAQKVMATCVTYTGGEAFGVHDASEYGAPKEKKGVFYLGFEGTKGEVDSELAFVKDIVKQTGGMIADHDHTTRFMSRYVIQWCGARVATGYEGPLTTYVPMNRMREFYKKLHGEILPKYGSRAVPGEEYSLDVGKYRIVAARYFVPQGEKSWERYRGMLREIAELATTLGGSISTCHGVGLEHRDDLELEYDEVSLDVMRALKKTLDPDNIMNPGKKIPDKK